MGTLTRMKGAANTLLQPLNLRLESLTSQRQEDDRLQGLLEEGHFDRPIFPVPDAFRGMDPEPIFRALTEHTIRMSDFRTRERNEVGFALDNGFFGSPDAEVLYAVLRSFRPGVVVEVGSGWSTRLIRQAIMDGGLRTKLVSVDPKPRTDADALVDLALRNPIERIPFCDVFGSMGPGDVLFIDSSHRVCTGSDVVHLLLKVLPALPAGALIHLHDIFLPFDYLREWVVERRWGWNEQYLVQAILTHSSKVEVLWAGRYLQATRPNFDEYFPNGRAQPATSLWIRFTS